LSGDYPVLDRSRLSLIWGKCPFGTFGVTGRSGSGTDKKAPDWGLQSWWAASAGYLLRPIRRCTASMLILLLLKYSTLAWMPADFSAPASASAAGFNLSRLCGCNSIETFKTAISPITWSPGQFALLKTRPPIQSIWTQQASFINGSNTHKKSACSLSSEPYPISNLVPAKGFNCAVIAARTSGEARISARGFLNSTSATSASFARASASTIRLLVSSLYRSNSFLFQLLMLFGV
jgi:hypothetical protein